MYRKPMSINLKKFVPKKFPFQTTQVLVAALIVAAFFLGSLYTKVQYLEKNGATPTAAVPNAGPSAAPQKVTVDNGHFPIKGDKNAKVTVLEFADLRCPFCERFFTQTEPLLLKEYVDTGKVKFAFRNYAFLGPASTLAAKAVECANDQDKFWEMYEYMYKNQPSETDTTMYTNENMSQAAGTLGMNAGTFQTCMEDPAVDQKVSKDLSDGQAAGVNGTPTFFINGTPIVGAVPYAQIKAAIDAELAK